MCKKILSENFINSSKAYREFYDALMEEYDSNPIMQCLLQNLHSLADNYYLSILDIQKADMTIGEAIKIYEEGN